MLERSVLDGVGVQYLDAVYYMVLRYSIGGSILDSIGLQCIRWCWVTVMGAVYYMVLGYSNGCSALDGVGLQQWMQCI